MKKNNSFLRQNTRCKMTSVFLPTTAAAITSFLTGEAPQQHAITSWFMSLKEAGLIAKILPFVSRLGGANLSDMRIKIEDIIMEKPFSKKINVKSYCLNPKELLETPYTNALNGKSQKIGFKDNFKDMLSKIGKVLNKKERKYVYAYWPMVDACLHEFGVGSRQEKNYFKEIDDEIRKFQIKIKGTNSIILIVADHGHINTPEERNINLKKYPEIYECLSQPLSGEGRTPFCYVHPDKQKQFEYYVKTKLSKYCSPHKSSELISRNFFGLGKPNRKLFQRTGDYILLTKENYRIKDYLTEHEKENVDIGHHGGLSKEEMFVPLIVLSC
jgi:predicted AlkP superfamily pyrophosphatase or phosphodiesterase